MTATAFALPVSTASVRDYIALLKPRVMTLVVFSGIAGMVAAPGHIHPLLAVAGDLFAERRCGCCRCL
jgi:protoheme IX farnesyltransferase